MNGMRLIVDPPQAGSWNMSVDRALLKAANDHGQITLRFYRWSRATLSLGYFQKAGDRAKHPASAACDWVRRTSGGGAILHHHDLTYSICLPASHPVARRNTDLYHLVHDSLIESLRPFGIRARKATDDDVDAAGSKAFLCFLRIHEGDLLVGNRKIGGSAQRRDRNALLQHGSLLLQRSVFAAELPGLAELCDLQPQVDRMTEHCSERIADRLHLTIQPTALEQREEALAREIESEQFANPAWNFRR